MMTDEQVLGSYEDMMRVSELMLVATQQGQWDDMAAQQEALSGILAGLGAGEGGELRSADIMAAKKRLIEDILVVQKMTLELSLPLRASVAAMLDSAGSAKKIAHAYGQGGA